LTSDEIKELLVMGDKKLRQKVNSNLEGTNFNQGTSSGYDCF